MVIVSDHGYRRIFLRSQGLVFAVCMVRMFPCVLSKHEEETKNWQSPIYVPMIPANGAGFIRRAKQPRPGQRDLTPGGAVPEPSISLPIENKRNKTFDVDYVFSAYCTQLIVRR